jgi:hypothetical protein
VIVRKRSRYSVISGSCFCTGVVGPVLIRLPAGREVTKSCVSRSEWKFAPLRRKRIELTKLGGIQLVPGSGGCAIGNTSSLGCGCWRSLKGRVLCICHRYAPRGSLWCVDTAQRGPCPSGCGNFCGWLRRIRGEFLLVCIAPLVRNGCCVADVAVERSRATCL